MVFIKHTRFMGVSLSLGTFVLGIAFNYLSSLFFPKQYYNFHLHCCHFHHKISCNAIHYLRCDANDTGIFIIFRKKERIQVMHKLHNKCWVDKLNKLVKMRRVYFKRFYFFMKSNEMMSLSALHKRKVLTVRTSPLTSNECVSVMNQLFLTSPGPASVMLICWSRGMLQ